MEDLALLSSLDAEATTVLHGILGTTNSNAVQFRGAVLPDTPERLLYLQEENC